MKTTKLQLADTLPIWKARSTWAFLIAVSTLFGVDVSALMGVDNAAIAAQTISSGISAIADLTGVGGEKVVSTNSINSAVGIAALAWGVAERLNPGKRLTFK